MTMILLPNPWLHLIIQSQCRGYQCSLKAPPDDSNMQPELKAAALGLVMYRFWGWTRKSGSIAGWRTKEPTESYRFFSAIALHFQWTRNQDWSWSVAHRVAWCNDRKPNPKCTWKTIVGKVQGAPSLLHPQRRRTPEAKGIKANQHVGPWAIAAGGANDSFSTDALLSALDLNSSDNMSAFR